MTALTPRERFLTALTGGVPDQVPIFDFLFDQALYQHVIGRTPEGYNYEDAIALSLALGLDAVYLPTGAPRGYESKHLGTDTYVTEWGSTRQRNPASWPIDAPIAFPIQSRADWASFRPPDPLAAGRMDPICSGLKLADGRLAVLGSVGGPFTPSWEQTGIDVFSMLIYDDPGLVREILRAHTDYSIAIARQLVETGVDAVLVSDDFGWNGGTLVSPQHFRELVLPLFVELVSTIRSAGKPVLLHTCGNVNAILDDLAASGINGYNPLQRTANMDIARVKKMYGSRISLSGNVDSSVTLPFGSKEDVERETRECIQTAGPGGGYMLGSDHSLHGGIPVENMLAMIEAGKRYGKYLP
jgi:uroporphyrinogen decarboxylase